jgi:hypothetical protein
MSYSASSNRFAFPHSLNVLQNDLGFPQSITLDNFGHDASHMVNFRVFLNWMGDGLLVGAFWSSLTVCMYMGNVSLGGFRIEVTVNTPTLKEAKKMMDKTSVLDPNDWLGIRNGPHAPELFKARSITKKVSLPTPTGSTTKPPNPTSLLELLPTHHQRNRSRL